MKLTDLFIHRPVLSTVISLLILALGLRSMNLLPVRQYPFTQNAVVTITTYYTGADPSVIAGFITTPLENSIAQANGIDYLTSSSTQGTSTIQANLRLNYDPNKALSEITTQVNAVLNQLPKDAQQPELKVAIGETLSSMYIGFNSDVLPSNKITDYLIRVVQPKLQAVQDVQTAEILGGRYFAMRAWLDPVKMAAYGFTAADVSKALAVNDFITAPGRTDGEMITVNMTADTDLHSVEEFSNLVLKSEGDSLVRLRDVANISLGSDNYNSVVSFDGKKAVYIGIKVAPAANLLTVIENIRKIFPEIQAQFPEGLNGRIVYDATKFVNSSITEVQHTLFEAVGIVTLVIFLFLGTLRSVLIPVVAIPLSLIGAFFIMLAFGYSINLLTLLALVLAIGLVVDDAIIVVENVYRHIEEGKSTFDAAIQGARELANPIIAITVVLIAVYVPIGFMGGLTGALFTEFAFTLAGAVAISAVVALTLSPMMCSRFLKGTHDSRFAAFIDREFQKLEVIYHRTLKNSLSHLYVTGVFSLIIFSSIYFLYTTSKSELAPQEDQGIVLSMISTAPNATLWQTQRYADQVNKIFEEFPEKDHVFQVSGQAGLNSSISGMVMKPWDERVHTSNQLQPILQQKVGGIAGARSAVFQLPSLPGGGTGLPIQFVIGTTEHYSQLNDVALKLMEAAQKRGIFMFIDSDLKVDKMQATLQFDRDKTAALGLTMQDLGQALSSGVGGGYVNYFNLDGRSYKVIPQLQRTERLNPEQLLNTYIRVANGQMVLLSTVAHIKRSVVPESINHFQQLNSATISGVAAPGVTMGDALTTLKTLSDEILPHGYSIDYSGQSRQYVQEGSELILTFLFAIIIIFLSLSALFESFRDPLIVLISVPMSICGAMIFINLGIGGASLNIYTEVGLVTLIGLISKHGILIVQFANDLQKDGKMKREAIEMASSIRLRPILMTTAAMVLGVLPLITATGAGAVSRFNIGLVIASGISIGTLFTLYVVPAMYMLLADDLHKTKKTGYAPSS
ncbi:efflux RND transporter permease subunit [Candidatus Nucleicultrix amoebiphila]|jgi:multidrug efflux pump|uniref:Acriflavine resistance protein B n=1 Tax=Candidatus Nucleicultrix amoebiphila FS5 TaxID=1414854 RepID=A0A1W6N2M2_9PROT|nr:efflux RND transporter permease subunit [Candidatus Nucleicultrix amoebiphila]ARN84120.1 acriflavine resistance protein B [Candidatus Nucleicultrix amoebiphila FS5]